MLPYSILAKKKRKSLISSWNPTMLAHYGLYKRKGLAVDDELPALKKTKAHHSNKITLDKITTPQVSELFLRELKIPPIRDREPDPFPFMNLPAEIRIMVYEYVLPSSDRGPPIPLKDSSNPEETIALPQWRMQYPLCQWNLGNMSLLRTSKQVRAEASHVFWSTNIFDIVLTPLGAFIDLCYRDESCPDGRPSRACKNVGEVPLDYFKLVRRLCIAFPAYTNTALESGIMLQSLAVCTGPPSESKINLNVFGDHASQKDEAEYSSAA
ncbi:hypothetical protein AOQ84DRAFT_442666 [Glonium stellatum]|uniref:F-box domain-containing protein n=1 Tax=Glonium stellatum TaxID=574774 RepID=A0A8E2JNT3_9PEZI|nr:hypothetical protein AOQ84DRAFT_442666 [Glonium stellatum]